MDEFNDDENRMRMEISKIKMELNGELQAMSDELRFINKAHHLLDILINSPKSKNRIIDLHNFLSQISLIVDYERNNEYPCNTNQLYALAVRASDFAMSEAYRIKNEQFAKELLAFVEQFETFVNDLKSSRKGTYDSILEEERQGMRPVRYSVREVFKDVPTKDIVESFEAQKQQQEQQKQIKSRAPRLGKLSEARKQELLGQVSKNPEKFLHLDISAFYDIEFARQLRETAIEHFPKAYKTHARKVNKESVSKEELQKAEENFVEFANQKMQKMRTEIEQNGKNM